jgi:hypothetical protein
MQVGICGGGGGEDAKKWTHVGGGEDAKKWNQIQEFEIIFIGLLLVHNPQKTDLNECNWMSQCLNVQTQKSLSMPSAFEEATELKHFNWQRLERWL